MFRFRYTFFVTHFSFFSCCSFSTERARWRLRSLDPTTRTDASSIVPAHCIGAKFLSNGMTDFDLKRTGEILAGIFESVGSTDRQIGHDLTFHAGAKTDTECSDAGTIQWSEPCQWSSTEIWRGRLCGKHWRLSLIWDEFLWRWDGSHDSQPDRSRPFEAARSDDGGRTAETNAQAGRQHVKRFQWGRGSTG